MRFFRGVFVGIAVLGVMLFVSGAAFAQSKHEAKIKVLQDSAAALQASNPDLAKGLNDMANEMAAKMEAKKEQTAKDSPEWKAKHEARVKLLQDSAAALQKTNPDLAASLQKMSEGRNKSQAPDVSGQKNENTAPPANTEAK